MFFSCDSVPVEVNNEVVPIPIVVFVVVIVDAVVVVNVVDVVGKVDVVVVIKVGKIDKVDRVDECSVTDTVVSSAEVSSIYISFSVISILN